MPDRLSTTSDEALERALTQAGDEYGVHSTGLLDRVESELGGRGPGPHSQWRRFAVAAFALAVAGTGFMVGLRAIDPGTPEPPAGREPEPRYQASAMVLETPRQPPTLCVGGIRTSLPPAGCGGVEIANWDWSAVEGEQGRGEYRWGEWHLVGTYDGERFTVEEIGPYRAPLPPTVDQFTTPCDEPAGGWVNEDRERATIQHLETFSADLALAPDYAGAWVDYVGPPKGEAKLETPPIVLNVAYTGDLDRHRAELRELWGGPLCVVEHEHTYAELQAIQAEIHETLAADFGLHVLGSGLSETRNLVEVDVVLATGEHRAAVDARYGPGVVVLTSALRPA